MKFHVKKKKTDLLDEMQEQQLLHIEKDAFWLLFWSLLAVIAIQVAIEPGQILTGQVAGEMFCFLLAAIVMIVRCIRAGIWDRHIRPTMRNNLWMSLAGGAAVAVFSLITSLLREEVPTRVIIFFMVFGGVLTFLLCFVLLTILGIYTKKRQDKLEEEPENDRGNGSL